MSTARLLPYQPACSDPEGVPGSGVLVSGVPGPGGACSWGVYLVPGGCTWFQGVPGSGGVPGPGGYLVLGGFLVWGVYLVLGGVPGPKGVYLVPGGTCPGIPPPSPS